MKKCNDKNIKNSYDVNNNGSMSLSELAKLVAHLLQVV